MSKLPKAQLDGWVDAWNDKPTKRLPNKCPKCGGKLWKTDAQRLIGQIVLGCKDSRCRWCCIYEA